MNFIKNSAIDFTVEDYFYEFITVNKSNANISLHLFNLLLDLLYYKQENTLSA